ncbi:RluA family pseudouridine synthase [Massilia antarctica]|uniref:RluA family pseudouridine synthase n=1 Tax=Massilia antarctica TaxID=2765360 RepID=UPI0006BB6F60|nr:RluA family pseudouridine synthase [Massilia sp. H27-R4]MCY0915927.1 RluA family pseudouridine synthase [Massilia sp. H27-R4]CUI07286.1 Similar to ribosomal large subunit pseudouridine synthase A [Janthinobacterium sp. CG23_2]CUU31072.1 Similar to ribosomal large subunit pseudouridine synthase A [Janthinobacterium sp. CG23_2]
MGRQAKANAVVPLPVRDGVAPSYLWLDDKPPGGALAFLAAHFADVGEAVWRDRMARGEVVDASGALLSPNSVLRRGMRIWYYRELDAETPIPFEEEILFRDDHLLVVDKPHFLPMTPGGRFLHETLLVRLKNKTGLTQLTPIHRLDRETAGVVIFSHREESRGAYQSLFQKRSVHKVYEALAAPLPELTFPLVHRSRMVEGNPFFRMQEIDGEPNSESVIDVIGAQGDAMLYRLQPHTGRKHQLRVHMAALGAPIINDAFYPEALPCKGDDFANPLKLLARSIGFDDPLSGQARRFESRRTL